MAPPRRARNSRLHQREGQPRDRADVDAGPGEQRHEEGEAEHEAEPEAGAEPLAVDGEGEGRGAERRQRGQVVAGEREQRARGHPAAASSGAPGPPAGRGRPEGRRPPGGAACRCRTPALQVLPARTASRNVVPGPPGATRTPRSDVGPDRCAVAAVLTQHPIPASVGPVPGPPSVRAGRRGHCPGRRRAGTTAGPRLRAGRPVAGGDRLDRCLMRRSEQAPPGWPRPQPPAPTRR